jgi:hypothetical protein
VAVKCPGAISCSQTLHTENWAARFHRDEVYIHRLNLGAVESDPPRSIEYRVLEPEENTMFNLSSRMKLPTRLSGFTALAIAGAAALSTPAYAAKQSDVVAACKRTKGCEMGYMGGDAYGCSPHACFNCSNGKCHQVRSSDVAGRRGIGTMSPGLLEGGGSLSTNSPSGTGTVIGGSSRGAAGAAVR